MDRRLHGLAIYCLSRKVPTLPSVVQKTSTIKTSGLASTRSGMNGFLPFIAPRKSHFRRHQPTPPISLPTTPLPPAERLEPKSHNLASSQLPENALFLRSEP